MNGRATTHETGGLAALARLVRADRPAAMAAALLALVVIACFATLPYTLGPERPSNPGGATAAASPRFDLQHRAERLRPPSWIARTPAPGATTDADGAPVSAVYFPMGSDLLGRDLLVRCLVGGAISLGIGIAAALISVTIGMLYGAAAGYVGGRTDALMMRTVDVLYGLPYVLLVVLLSVAADATIDRWQASRVTRTEAARLRWIAEESARLPGSQRGGAAADLRERSLEKFGTGEFSNAQVQMLGILTLLTAIGGVSWLTMARVVRGQVLSLKGQPFMEAARAVGVPPWRQFTKHLLPNLMGPVIVYATLTVPQAILQESFLSFLGIGVRPPLPSWGNLAADGLSEINRYHSHWWLLLFPCLLIAGTLICLNMVGESLRRAMDPRSVRR